MGHHSWGLMLKFVNNFGDMHETKLLEKNKLKNFSLNLLAIILCIVFFAYLYCYNEYFAGWYYDSLPLQNRNFLNYIILILLRIKGNNHANNK